MHQCVTVRVAEDKVEVLHHHLLALGFILNSFQEYQEFAGSAKLGEHGNVHVSLYTSHKLFIQGHATVHLYNDLKARNILAGKEPKITTCTTPISTTTAKKEVRRILRPVSIISPRPVPSIITTPITPLPSPQEISSSPVSARSPRRNGDLGPLLILRATSKSKRPLRGLRTKSAPSQMASPLSSDDEIVEEEGSVIPRRGPRLPAISTTRPRGSSCSDVSPGNDDPSVTDAIPLDTREAMARANAIKNLLAARGFDIQTRIYRVWEAVKGGMRVKLWNTGCLTVHSRDEAQNMMVMDWCMRAWREYTPVVMDARVPTPQRRVKATVTSRALRLRGLREGVSPSPPPSSSSSSSSSSSASPPSPMLRGRVPKRGRGRPRKHPRPPSPNVESAPSLPRKRGRPRNPLPTPNPTPATTPSSTPPPPLPVPPPVAIVPLAVRAQERVQGNSVYLPEGKEFGLKALLNSDGFDFVDEHGPYAWVARRQGTVVRIGDKITRNGRKCTVAANRVKEVAKTLRRLSEWLEGEMTGEKSAIDLEDEKPLLTELDGDHGPEPASQVPTPPISTIVPIVEAPDDGCTADLTTTPATTTPSTATSVSMRRSASSTSSIASSSISLFDSSGLSDLMSECSSEFSTAARTLGGAESSGAAAGRPQAGEPPVHSWIAEEMAISELTALAPGR